MAERLATELIIAPDSPAGQINQELHWGLSLKELEEWRLEMWRCGQTGRKELFKSQTGLWQRLLTRLS